MTAPAQDPFVGKALGKFQIEKKLGQGGMGVVYKARDNLGRTVALKLLPAHFASQEEWLARFRREAEKAAQLQHPNIVQVFELDAVEGHHYISMQFMEGGSVDGIIAKRGPLSPVEAARIVRDATRGLARAHNAGVIHRDIKPANILLGPDGEVRLSDFGLVKTVKGGEDKQLTAAGMVLGTPHFMAPEQCEGLEDIDARADLYSMGIVLYQALSNVLPVKGTTPLQIIRYRMLEDPTPLRQVAPGAPAPLLDLVDALLVRDRAERLSSADEVVARLDAYLATAGGGGTQATPMSTVAARSAAAVVPAVPTGKLVRREPEVLPDLGPKASARPPTPAGVGQPPRPKPTPPKRGVAPCWYLGCFLGLAAVCLVGTLAAIGREDLLDPDAWEVEDLDPDGPFTTTTESTTTEWTTTEPTTTEWTTTEPREVTPYEPPTESPGPPPPPGRKDEPANPFDRTPRRQRGGGSLGGGG